MNKNRKTCSTVNNIVQLKFNGHGASRGHSATAEVAYIVQAYRPIIVSSDSLKLAFDDTDTDILARIIARV